MIELLHSVPYSPPSTAWVLRALVALLCRNIYAWASPAVSAVNAVCGPDPSDTSSAATPAVSPAKGLGGRALARAASASTPTPTRTRRSANGGNGADAVQQRRAAMALGAYDGTSPSPASRRAAGAAVQPGRRPAWWEDFEPHSPCAAAAAAANVAMTTAKSSNTGVQSPCGPNAHDVTTSPQEGDRQRPKSAGVPSPHLGDLPLDLVSAAAYGKGLCITLWCLANGYP